MNEEMIVRMPYGETKNEEEYHWMNRTGMKSYKRFNKYFVNPIFTKLYNLAWHWIDKIVKPKEDTDWIPDRHPNYDKLYFEILNIMIKPIIFLHGGYNFKTKRKVTLNYDYYMIPIKNGDGKVNYEFENFLNVKDFGD